MNDYEHLMQLRINEPKRFALLRIHAKYDLLVSRIKKHGKDEECIMMVNELNDFIKSMHSLYGISTNDLRTYFQEHNMSLSF